jgi:hypothetical protein
MSLSRVRIAVVAALVAASCAQVAVAQQAAGRAARVPAAPAVSAAEVEALKAQLQALQERLTQLEQAQAAATAKVEEATKSATDQAAVNTELQAAIDSTTDNLARTSASVGEWVGRWQWKGDLRYRNENIDQEFTVRERNRDRIRMRAGFFARVNDTVRVEVQVGTTEGDDARSSNQTLTDANSRKALDLDTAYAEWQPNAQWRVTLGKMRYPWVRTSSYFYDGDINPEGLAVNYQQGATGLFGSAFVTRLAERGAAADSNMFGAQLGWRANFGDGGRWLLAAGYYDHGGVEGYNVFQSGGAGGFFGNSTTTNRAICRSVVAAGAACLANDFDVLELVGEWQIRIANQPLLVYGNYAQNGKADFAFASTNPTLNIRDGLDTAYALGFQYGRASAPGSWEFGYMFQKVEKDALFGQWVDSDFAAGATDGDGSSVRFAYQFSRNWRANLTYLINKTNNDVATAVTFPTARDVFDRDYKRLQLDLNMTF